MDDVRTCGKGLASHTPMPRAMAEMADAMAVLFQVHMKALDPAEENGRREHKAYASLSAAYARVAELLAGLASEAESYRALPMAAHDMTFMTGPEPLAAFERVVAVRQSLLALLQELAGQDQAMLAEMRRSRPA